MATALVGALVTFSVIAGFIHGWLTTRIWVGRLLDLLSPRHGPDGATTVGG